MNESTVLLIGTDLGLIDTVRRVADGIDRLAVSVVGSLDEAYAHDGWDRIALVLIHLDRRCSTNGVARLLRMIAAARRPVATVILADGLDDHEATGLLRLGVADLLSSPLDLDRLTYLIEVLTLRARKPLVTTGPDHSEGDARSWDESDPMVAQARRVAPQDATVLIHGETGTGKSRLARLIHELSPRRHGPLVTLRCGAASSAMFLFEDELLGPPTGDGPRGGKVAEAREGTLLLDDVDSLSPPAQAALLGWIEDEVYAASTSARPRAAHPRLIATSRVPLGEEVAAGRFRSDLFYRLNVIGLQLPPLRQRRLEISSLAAELLGELGGRAVALAPEALLAVESYNWPGNLRELREALESTLSVAHGSVLGRELLPEAVRDAGLWPRSLSSISADDHATPNGSTTLAQTKREAEYARITQALEKHGHNRLRTAGELGISRMTLYKKLYKYGIIEQESREGRFPGGRGRRSPVATHSESPPGARFG